MANAHSRQGAIRMFFVEQHTWLLNYVGPGSPETSVHNAPDSRLRYPWIAYSLPRLRPGYRRTEFSVLARALSCRPDPAQGVRTHGPTRHSEDPLRQTLAQA